MKPTEKSMTKRLLKKITILSVMLAVTAGSFGFPVCAYGASFGPDIKGQAAIVYCASTDEILWQKNSDKKMNPASITKLMTCLIAIEKLGLDEKVTVKQSAVDAAWLAQSEAWNVAGEELTVEELVYEAMLVSSNDAAITLAAAVSGSEKEFAELMNKRAEEIGCTNTNFINASGIEEKNHYSTAADVVKIAKEALSNKELLRIAGTGKYILPKTNKSESRDLENSNYFLEGGKAKIDASGNTVSVKKYKGVFGGKTGTTLARKATMVVGCEFDGLDVYVAVLDSTVAKRYSDVKKLLDYAKENISSYEAFPKGQEFDKGKLKGGATNRIEGVAAEAGIVNLPEGASASLVTTEALYDENLTAPIKKGQKIGSVEIYLADEPVRTIDLLAAKDIKKGWFLSSFGITNLQTVIIIAVLALTAGFFIMIAVLRISNRRKLAARRKERLKKIAMEQMERERDYRQRNWPY